jgi:hypothetical protein
LTQSADIVVFSAAIPGQGGKGHIHLKPPGFWNDLFSQHGYHRHDVLRPNIVTDQAIEWWYRQNSFIFASPTAKFVHGEVKFLPDDFYLIHESIVENPRGLKTLLRDLGPSLVSAIRRRIGRGGA